MFLKIGKSSPSAKEKAYMIYIIPQDCQNDEKYIKHSEFH